MSQTPDSLSRATKIGQAEFVSLIALLMALTALSIDIMLVALPEIAHTYGVLTSNEQQFVITAYMVGFALGQPIHGPLSDRFGRKPLIAVGLVIMAIGSLCAAFAPSFALMLAARALQGFGAAAPRVVGMAVVRDRFAGRDMARIMSFVMMVFIIVPVIAPAVGEGIVLFAGWRWTFLILFAAAAIGLIWSAVRLPETRSPADRLPLSPAALGGALRVVLTNRITVGYTVGAGFMFGGLLAYVGSSQQIFVEVYELGNLFPLAFGSVAAMMALSSLTNARLVGRIGMRRVSHTALVLNMVACTIIALMGFPEHPPLLVFCGFLAVVFFCFGLIAPNFNAMAMEPLGHVAGMGSSFSGSYTTGVGALIGWLVGQSFDGTVRPLLIGFAFFGLATLVTVLVTERGALFRTTPHPNPQPGE